MSHLFRRSAAALLILGAPGAVLAQTQSGNSFNPKISLILNGQYAHYSSKAPADVAGALLGGESDYAPEGFSIGETELAIESNIDDQFHGWTAISIGNDGHGNADVSVEEAYINTLALPDGLAVKLGRFFSDIGYQNHVHAHAWDFADAPLVYRTFFGGQLGDDGVQLRWLAPTDLFLEIGAEGLRGDAFPAGGDSRSGVEAWTAFAHVGGDIGFSGSWRLGAWHYDGKSDDRRSSGDEDVDTSFTGKSHINGLDFVYKWAPNGNPEVHNFVLQAEAMRRSENGSVIYDPDGAADASAYDGTQFGWYVQGVYQFIQRWRVGLRYDRMNASNSVANPVGGTSLATLADDGDHPQRVSAMLDFSNSEFSRIRLQYNRDESRPDNKADNQILVQYIFAMGSHPAHQF
ncbi:hypothetical protein [Solimonas terrae]|uniref:Porin n=1 Tax=Solimonas terrae TaxID=1396819 RepID=A0A6M2BTS8_9GAMM|nr:hypothetical protein [Solimonas terrae]NGY05868.1 hypothetical protein [Solimonas terrae]